MAGIMDNLRRLTSGFTRGLTEKLEPEVRQHLKNVYSVFMLAILAAAAGGYAHMYTSLIGAGPVTVLWVLGCYMFLQMTPPDERTLRRRLNLLLSMVFCCGCNLGPLLKESIISYPAVVMQALLGTSVVFACFSLSALFAPRGHYLYLGGTLLSSLSLLMYVSLLNILVGSNLLSQVHLFLGLGLVCAFIAYDTQRICDEARQGNKDYVKHALDLFSDFMGMFYRLLIILTTTEANQKKTKRKC